MSSAGTTTRVATRLTLLLGEGEAAEPDPDAVGTDGPPDAETDALAPGLSIGPPTEGGSFGGGPAVAVSVYVSSPAVTSITPSAVNSAGRTRVRMRSNTTMSMGVHRTRGPAGPPWPITAGTLGGAWAVRRRSRPGWWRASSSGPLSR